MHKDKPPGIFDFAQRSIRYLIGFWLVTGFLLSLVVHLSLLVWRGDSGREAEVKSEENLERSTAPIRKNTPAPTDPSVKY
jgi:hypothetical protein